MRATVLLFASARERAGRSSIEVELADTATVADVKTALSIACPALIPLLSTIRLAIDAEYAEDDQPIPTGAELAAIPPVSGGSLS